MKPSEFVLEPIGRTPPKYSVEEIESAGERFHVASADGPYQRALTAMVRRAKRRAKYLKSSKCEQCGEGGAPLHEDLGVRLCDENCRECWLSCQPNGEELAARAEVLGTDESYLDG